MPKTTLQNLGKIFDYAKARNIPVMLVIFPLTFQFDDVNTLSGPQKIVSKYASDNKVPVIDLLPMLSKKMHEEGVKTGRFVFWTWIIYRLLGVRLSQTILADFIQNERLITDEGVK